MNNEEVWKDIKEYEGAYEVSSFGNVRETLTNILLPQSDVDGYRITALKKGTKKRVFRVHRLVAQAFLPDWNSELVVDHKDTNRSNNHYTNLQMLTIAENNRKIVSDGNANKRGGKKHKVNQIDPNSYEVINTYESFAAAARALGKLHPSAGDNIRKTVTGTRTGQKAYGYFWELVN